MTTTPRSGKSGGVVHSLLCHCTQCIPNPHEQRWCPECDGSGVIVQDTNWTLGNDTDYPCDFCNEDGVVTFAQVVERCARAGLLPMVARVLWDRARPYVQDDQTEAKAA